MITYLCHMQFLSEKFRSLVKPNPHVSPSPPAEWELTRIAEARVKSSSFYEERGLIRKEKLFAGRPIIGRDSVINGGVYVGGSEREAIVVDDTKDQALEKIYQELLRRRQQAEQQGAKFKVGVLTEVWKLVSDVMPYDKGRVDEIESTLPKPDTKMYLSSYIGGGVCRHQALLAGYLLERLSKEGKVGGRVSIDRNFVADRGGHAWARYENSGGETYIIDPAQGYLGRLEEINEDRWFYERPEDTSTLWKLRKKVKRLFTG